MKLTLADQAAYNAFRSLLEGNGPAAGPASSASLQEAEGRPAAEETHNDSNMTKSDSALARCAFVEERTQTNTFFDGLNQELYLPPLSSSFRGFCPLGNIFPNTHTFC